MLKLIDENDPEFCDFCNDVCTQCVNETKSCDPIHKCSWTFEFDEARKLLSKLRYIEDDPDHIYGVSPDDDNFDFNAQSEAWLAVDNELSEIKEGIINDVGENLVEYYKYYGYEM